MSRIFVSCMELRQLSQELPSEPPNHGQIWTTPMKTELARDFYKMHDLHALCTRFGRTPDSIVAKLRDLNLLRYSVENSTYLYNIPMTNKPDNQPDNQPETKLENDMTQPLNNITFLFGNDIKKCSESDLISVINKCQNEITSFSVIPRNKWTDKRTAELHDAITAAIAELDTRA